MGYMHIDNLYKNIDILMFKECYAMEKIHGTSAHIQYKDNKILYFSGGSKHETFRKLFNHGYLLEKFEELFGDDNVIVYGEAYGGKLQGMSDTYGKELKFIVFDVKVGNMWLDVPDAESVAALLKLEFVDYVRCATDKSSLNYERDKPSTQAIRNGCGNGKQREGVVLRPLIEVTKKNGKRIIVKHKADSFSETKTKRDIDPEKLKILKDAIEIAEEWVTPMRLNHVLDKLTDIELDIKYTGKVIYAMIKDVRREAKGEIVENQEVMKAIGKKTAQLFKKRISKIETDSNWTQIPIHRNEDDAQIFEISNGGG